MKITFVVVLLVLLFGCTIYPEKKIRVEVLVDEREDAQEYCSKLLEKDARACTIINTPQNCRIVIDPISANENLNLLGHEFLHCLEGPWHVEWKENRFKDIGINFNPYK